VSNLLARFALLAKFTCSISAGQQLPNFVAVVESPCHLVVSFGSEVSRVDHAHQDTWIHTGPNKLLLLEEMVIERLILFRLKSIQFLFNL
jgi:hypothetical protein